MLANEIVVREVQGGCSGGGEGEMRTVKCLGALLFLCLTACASSAPPPASAAEIDAASGNLANCLGRAAEQLDDGKSDAATIGLAIEPLCTAQFSQLSAVIGRGLNPAAYNLYLEKNTASQLEIATGMVLKVRSLRAQKNSN